MAAGHDENVHDDPLPAHPGHDAQLRPRPGGATAVRGGHDAPTRPRSGGATAVGGHGTAEDHDAPGHQSDHGGHDEHGTGGDLWVVPPLVIGLVMGLLIAIVIGLGSGAVAFG